MRSFSFVILWQRDLGKMFWSPLYGYMSLAEHLWKTPVEFSSGWNFGPNQNSVKTVQETVDLAMQFWGNSSDWVTSNGNHLHEQKLLQLNSEKANELLDWEPKLDFDEAVNKTIMWYKTYYTNKQEMMEYTLNQIEEYESKSINV